MIRAFLLGALIGYIFWELDQMRLDLDDMNDRLTKLETHGKSGD